MYIVGKIIGFIIASFVGAVLVGSIVWFIGSVFGYEWDYFSYIKGWFIAVLIFDALISLYKFGIGE